MKYQLSVISLLSSFVLLTACTTHTNTTNSTSNNMNSTLWIQSAAEYKAHSIQVYNSATMSIDKAKNNTLWTAMLEQGVNYSNLPAAIIVDVDETVLDNSTYQAQLILEGSQWSLNTWDNWVAMKSAPAVPGAVEFINRMGREGVEVIYITNRECKPRGEATGICPQKQDTIDNLKTVGVEKVSADKLLLKYERPEWTSEKQTRREAIAKKFRVIMLFGDDLGDFLPNVKSNISPKNRDTLVYQYSNNWGSKWFTLANPTYGSWFRILNDPKLNYLTGIKY